MLNLEQMQADLFERWKSEKGYTLFISDGIFDTKTWQSQALKVLYVLKEANWEGGCPEKGLCNYLLSEESPTYWKTWNNIARWSKALLEGGDYPSEVTKQDKTKWMKRIAFLNLKKIGGGSVAVNQEIESFAISDKQYIKEQIELCDPDIIICCGRGNGKNADLLYYKVFEGVGCSEWKQTPNKYNYFDLKLPNSVKTIPVISFYHPQMRGGHEKFKLRYEDMLMIKEHLGF